MGNRQSLTITHPMADGKHIKQEEANGHAVSLLDLTDAVTCKASVDQNTEPPPVTVTLDVKPSAVSVDANATTGVSAESSTPGKDTPKQAETSSMFNKMFKKKTGPVSASTDSNVAAEVAIVPAVETASQKSVPTAVSVQAPTVSVDSSGIQINATTGVSTESSSPATPKKVETSRMFNNMFKKKTRDVSASSDSSMAAEVAIPAVETTNLKSEPTAVSLEANENQAKVPDESSTCKPAETSRMFNNMFKKKTRPVSVSSDSAAEVATVPTVETDSQKSEPTDVKASTRAEKEPQGEASISGTAEVTQDSTQPDQSSIKEKSVMNFFKTFVTSPKATKEATASPDVSKEKSQKETPPAPAANVQEASKIPPPPPPAPPKMESKAEPAGKKEEAPPLLGAAAAKEKESPRKAKIKDSSFTKLFCTKSGVKEEAKPVEIQVDASKTSTLEAGAKTEPLPQPKPEQKAAEKKPSPFANLLKPKVLLGQVSSKIHAAASSAAASISLGAGGGAAEPKKEAPKAPVQAAPSTKAKEEPKAAAPAAPPAASTDNKSVGSTDNSSPSTSRKLEKRNSIQLFFKNLGQKRHSDAEVQTEPVEKAK